ncbi:MAG: caspase family protein [Gemmatimonadetes bacterium]|nr:caspase family protein [Gemmatimonadota bacterium]
MESERSRRSALVVLPMLLALAVQGCGREPSGGQAAGAAPEQEGVGWGLVVGVSEYENFPPLASGADDANHMVPLLENSWGIRHDNIRVLLDKEATRAAIRSALAEWLPGVVRPQDFVMVFMAGYGSTLKDVSGDEEDGLDEAFCPTDALAQSPEHDILDDALALWLDGLPTERVTLIVDSDHSGHGDHHADHPGHDERTEEMPSPDATPVTRCGNRPVG